MLYMFEQVRRALEPCDFPTVEQGYTVEQESTVELVEDFLKIPAFDPYEIL